MRVVVTSVFTGGDGTFALNATWTEPRFAYSSVESYAVSYQVGQQPEVLNEIVSRAERNWPMLLVMRDVRGGVGGGGGGGGGGDS